MEILHAIRKAVFFTFYSYKGGVGRTTSLLNIANILAYRGRRVLMIDFDLEAPGLTALTTKANYAVSTSTSPIGLLELIQDFLNEPEASPLASGQEERLHKYIIPIAIPDEKLLLEGGILDLMPSGCLDDDFGKRLSEINLSDLYQHGLGQPFFLQLKDIIIKLNRYDYVLIDSRTGFSDESGICTRDLADYIVLVTGLNHQNIDGTVRFLRRLKASKWQFKADPQTRMLFVASPIPVNQEDELRVERTNQAGEAIAEVGFGGPFDLILPYHPRLALDEDPLTFPWSTTQLYSAYLTLSLKIRALVQDAPADILPNITQAVNSGRYEEALHLLKQVRIEDKSSALVALAAITDLWTDYASDKAIYLDRFFDLWFEITESASYVHRQYSKQLIHRGELLRASQELEHSFAICLEQGDEKGLTLTRLSRGFLHTLQGQYNDARTDIELALNTFLQQADDAQTNHQISVAYHQLAVILYDQRNYSGAAQAYEEALDFANTRGYAVHAGAALSELGKIKVYQGEYELGLDMVRRSRQIIEQPPNIPMIAEAYVDEIECCIAAGDFLLAADGLKRYWTFIEQCAYKYVLMIAYVLRALVSLQLNDEMNALLDASKAHSFFEEQGVDTYWSRKAAEIVSVTKS